MLWPLGKLTPQVLGFVVAGEDVEEQFDGGPIPPLRLGGVQKGSGGAPQVRPVIVVDLPLGGAFSLGVGGCLSPELGDSVLELGSRI